MILPAVVLIAIAIGARFTVVGGRPLPTTADVALPWLVAPPTLLLVISQIRPLYDFRYVLFCLPAVALLAADGLCWLAWFCARGRRTARLRGPP